MTILRWILFFKIFFSSYSFNLTLSWLQQKFRLAISPHANCLGGIIEYLVTIYLTIPVDYFKLCINSELTGLAGETLVKFFAILQRLADNGLCECSVIAEVAKMPQRYPDKMLVAGKKVSKAGVLPAASQIVVVWLLLQSLPNECPFCIVEGEYYVRTFSCNP